MLQTVQFDSLEDLKSIELQWQNLLSLNKNRNNFNDIDWYRLRIHENGTRSLVVAAFNQDFLECFLPCEKKKIDLKLSVSGHKILRLPFKAANVLGDCIVGDKTSKCYDSIFGHFYRVLTSYDVVCFSQVPLDSFLYKYIHTSPEINQQFTVYHPLPTTPRYIVDLSAADSLLVYFTSLNKKRMRNLRRLKRKLQDKLGYEVKADCYTSPDTVSELLKRSEQISRQSWQDRTLGRRLGRGDLSLDFLSRVAEKGWLRSYILTCGNNYLSFLFAFQFNKCLYLREMGYDPSWMRFSVGNILWMLVFEDMFSRDTPSIADFGYGDADFKQFFSNYSYPETSLYLFRRTLRNNCLINLHRYLSFSFSKCSSIAEKWGFKKYLKAFFRGL